MRNTLYVLLLFAFLFGACRQKSQSSTLSEAKDSTTKESLYPYPQYIQSQIAYLDTVPLGLEMVVYENGIKTDSNFISREKFKELSKEFMEPDPNKKELRNQYEESSFNDLSLNTITFSIVCKNPANDLRQADILLNPDTKQVKYLVIKKQKKIGNSEETKSLMWVHNRNFQISTSLINDQGLENKKVVKVVWDNTIY